jgi:hypothetical protein
LGRPDDSADNIQPHGEGNDQKKNEKNTDTSEHDIFPGSSRVSGYLFVTIQAAIPRPAYARKPR